MRRRLAGGVLGVLVAVVALPTGLATPGGTATASPSAYVALDPARRVVDTRAGAALAPGEVRTVAVGGRFGIPPAEATAVVVNLTVVAGAAPGFLQVAPTAGGFTTSALNVERPGQTVAAMSVVPLGPQGSFALRSEQAAHVLVDVVGWFRPAERPRGGRIVTVTAARALDTRAGTRLAAGEVRRVSVAGALGVPARQAAAVVVNLTAVNAGGAGHLQVGASAVEAETSRLNTDGPGQTRANLAIVALAGDGSFVARSSVATDLLVDVVGYVTSGEAAADAAGTFVALGPARVIDTRGGPPLTAGAAVSAAPGAAGVPATGASAVLATVTATAAAAGYLAAGPSPAEATGTSTLNPAGPSSTVANAAVVRTGAGGIAVTTSARTHVLVDIAGYLVGTPSSGGATNGTDAWAFWGHLWADGTYSGGSWTWHQEPYPFAESAARFRRGAAANGFGVTGSYRTVGGPGPDLRMPTTAAATEAFLAAVVEDEGSACSGLIEDDPDRRRLEQLAVLLDRVGVAYRLEGSGGFWSLYAARASWPAVQAWPYATTARTPGVGWVCP